MVAGSCVHTEQAEEPASKREPATAGKAATTVLDLQSELNQDGEAAATVDHMDRPPAWEGEPVNEADVAEIHAEAAPTDPSPKRPAAPALPTGPEPAPKKQKFYDFRTGSWTEAPPRMQIPSRRADALGKLRKNMCELCGQKSKNYGLRGRSKQWCGPCGKLRGGTLHCM